MSSILSLSSKQLQPSDITAWYFVNKVHTWELCHWVKAKVIETSTFPLRGCIPSCTWTHGYRLNTMASESREWIQRMSGNSEISLNQFSLKPTTLCPCGHSLALHPITFDCQFSFSSNLLNLTCVLHNVRPCCGGSWIHPRTPAWVLANGTDRFFPIIFPSWKLFPLCPSIWLHHPQMYSNLCQFRDASLVSRPQKISQS